jgi:UDP-N-acetylglucosamine--N-acetylmuramyl-(pentapeptide) pyrophosphoryl-undecaprenol N-acetylglucosamine transferase
MKRIVLTGGGTAGHVTPCIALLPALKEEGYDIQYIGSYNGIERKLIEEYRIPYHGISSGKLRRYFDLKNFSDPFRVIKGYREACKIIKQLDPDIVFSKGGFVSVPVVFAAKKYKIPVIIHESDMTPGLANKLAIPAAKKVCANFPETLEYLPPEKAVLTGTPIRKELFSGNKIHGLDFCGFTANRPVILIIGGSTGSKAINEVIRGMLPTLVRDYQIS